jgi:hypothetical protein
MDVLPPPKPRRKRRSAQFIVLVIIAVLGGVLAVRAIIIASGITKWPDSQFGDQHLKTAVALIELHKVRFGKYPGSLSDLKFTGQWDQIALQSVSYYPNSDYTSYYIEVETGWIGKPNLKLPDEFWRGTGYTTSLKPTNR